MNLETANTDIQPNISTDILIVGSGCSGLYAALHLPKDKQITIISKSDLESSDSFLAQGGMCMLKDDSDYESYFEDTMKAGHYENDPGSVDIMIRSSKDVVEDLVSYQVDFQRESDGSFAFTKEGAHSDKRILFHKDITGKEITSHLLAEVKRQANITLLEYTTMLDLLCVDSNQADSKTSDNICYGIIARTATGEIITITADYTILATGGIGGIYRHSTNYRHLTGDAVALALKHSIKCKDVNYIQIHPTTFYSEREEDRSFLISESVRGEGAKLYGKDGQRFVDELLPRDIVANAIKEQMKKDGTNHVWEDLRPIPQEELELHFPNIVAHCKEMGYDVTKECIPVVPAQHYYMGGIAVDYQSKTSMEHLYAVGETACNGVHGANRLASNSLLESMVFAKRAAKEITDTYSTTQCNTSLLSYDKAQYEDAKQLQKEYKQILKKEIERLDLLQKEAI